MYTILLLDRSSYFMREVYYRTIDMSRISIVADSPAPLQIRTRLHPPVWKARGLLARCAKKLGKEPPVFKPVKCPQAKFCPIRYDARSYWVKWDKMKCSLATVAGRIELPFTVPAYAQQYVGYHP